MGVCMCVCERESMLVIECKYERNTVRDSFSMNLQMAIEKASNTH